MPYYISLAFKNIFRQKKRSFTLGVNYFVVAILMLLLLSFSEGVKKNFSGNLIAAAAGHITLSGATVTKGKTVLGIADYPVIEKLLKAEYGDQVTVLTRYKLTSTVYYLGQSKSLSFQGIDTANDTVLRDQVNFVAGSWADYVAQDNGVLISKDTADYLKLKLDDEVLISTRTRFGAFNTATIRIKGIYESANYFVQGIVLCHFNFLQQLDLGTGSASSMFVYFPTTTDLEAKRDHIMALLGDAGFVASKPASSSEAISVVAAATPQYKMLGEDVNERRVTVATVNEVISILAQVLDAVNAAGGFLAGIMLFIIAISIFINMRMTINDRMQEIGTLRAIGTETADIVLMLIFENVFLSLLFVLAGLAAALLLILGVSTLLSLPPAGILSLFLDQGHLVLIPTLGSIGLITVVALVFTGVFSFFPARHGGKVRAVVALSKTY